MGSSDAPGWRTVRSPVTPAMLGPLKPDCRAITLRTRLSDDDYARLADVMQPRPDVHLYLSESVDDSIEDLEFLQYFPWFDQFYIDVASVRSLTGLRHLTAVRDLSIGGTRRPLSVTPLAGLTSLRHLSLEGPVKDTDALSALTGLRSLTLRSVTLDNLSVLVPMTGLQALDLKLGATRDLSLLPAFTELQYLELWQIRGFTDVSPVADAPSLDTLFLQSLKHVIGLPDLGKLAKLRRVHLEDMKGLTDLTPLLTAPALEELILTGMGHLQPAQIAPLATHPTLRRATLHLGSGKKNRAAAAVLPLPPAGRERSIPPFARHDLEAIPALRQHNSDKFSLTLTTYAPRPDHAS